jgi:hypothetical protein
MPTSCHNQYVSTALTTSTSLLCAAALWRKSSHRVHLMYILHILRTGPWWGANPSGAAISMICKLPASQHPNLAYANHGCSAVDHPRICKPWLQCSRPPAGHAGRKKGGDLHLAWQASTHPDNAAALSPLLPKPSANVPSNKALHSPLRPCH